MHIHPSLLRNTHSTQGYIDGEEIAVKSVAFTHSRNTEIIRSSPSSQSLFSVLGSFAYAHGPNKFGCVTMLVCFVILKNHVIRITTPLATNSSPHPYSILPLILPSSSHQLHHAASLNDPSAITGHLKRHILLPYHPTSLSRWLTSLSRWAHLTQTPTIRVPPFHTRQSVLEFSIPPYHHLQVVSLLQTQEEDSVGCEEDVIKKYDKNSLKSDHCALCCFTPGRRRSGRMSTETETEDTLFVFGIFSCCHSHTTLV